MSENVKNKPVVKIGFGLPWPQEMARDATGYCAAEMAIEKANQESDFPVHIELILINDERNPARALVVSQQFVDDPQSVGLIGPLNSPMCDASQAVYHRGGLAQITSEASSPMLTDRSYENFFRLVANDDLYGKMQARVAVQYLKAHRIVILHDASVWGEPLSAVFQQEIERLGVSPIHVRGFSAEEKNKNFDAMVQEVKEVNPDLIFFAVYWNPAHILAHQLRYARVGGIFLGTDALKSYPYLEVPGLDPSPPYQTFPGADMRINPRCREFFQAFANRYPQSLVNIQYAPEGYDAAGILIEAIRKTGKADRDQVLREIRTLTAYEGISQTIRFDPHGDLIDPEIGLYQCMDGLRKYIGSLRDLLPAE